MMDIDADELLDALARIETTMADAVQRAGQGANPEVERRLEAHLRSLRPLLDEAGFVAAGDAVDAARRVMTAADPEAPLLMLAMARKTLGALLRRLASQRPLRPAA
jgi:BMFP domain-containing protein YqiC